MLQSAMSTHLGDEALLCAGGGGAQLCCEGLEGRGVLFAGDLAEVFWWIHPERVEKRYWVQYSYGKSLFSSVIQL